MKTRRRLPSWWRRPRYLGWAARNAWHGYQFRPVRRHRCCGHTTPPHSAGCPRRSCP